MNIGSSVALLVEFFQRAYRERMQSLPVVNSALVVEPIGFREWEGRLLGVLIAPWFMNLVLLAGDNDDWSGMKAGTKQVWKLPSGDFEFTVAYVDDIGFYQSCPLFTVVLGFPDQASAKSVAKTIMKNVLTPGREAERLVRPVRAVAGKALPHRLSRRALFRRFLGVGRK